MAAQITIGLFSLLYLSSDGGQSWQTQERKLPEDYSPVFTGDADIKQIPFKSNTTYWRFLHFDKQKGRGVALDSSANLYFRKKDAGAVWQKQETYRFRLYDRLNMAFHMCWPAKSFDSMVVSQDFRVFLCWEDPWIMRGSKTHLLFSNADATAWRYRCVGDAFPWINHTPEGQVVLCSEKLMMISPDWGKTWKKRTFSIDFEDQGYKSLRWTPFQRIAFLDELEAYAITPIWFENSDSKAASNQMAVLKTNDGGRLWHQLSNLQIPDDANIGSINVDALISIHVA